MLSQVRVDNEPIYSCCHVLVREMLAAHSKCSFLNYVAPISKIGHPMLKLLFVGVVLLPLTDCRVQEDNERLIGWKGETYNAGESNQAARNEVEVAGAPTNTTPWIETISWAPRAFVYHNFLTHAECDHIVNQSKPRIARSLVVDSKTGASKLDSIRTSYGSSFGRGEDPVIAEVEERIAEWTHLPPENGEPMQVLRYVDGQKYDAHWDWFDDPVHHSMHMKDGNRLATVLLYLAEVEEGGETSLPLAIPIDEEAQTLPNQSECATRGTLAVRPRKGDALLFWDLEMDFNTGDRRALHASCPTLKGMKWTATKWIHNKRYMGDYNALDKAAKCMDLDRKCAQLVDNGDCYKNPEYMVGVAGHCRKSCEDCVECPAGDLLCMRRNLRSKSSRVTASHAPTISTKRS